MPHCQDPAARGGSERDGALPALCAAPGWRLGLVSSKDAAFSDGTLKAQHLELLPNLCLGLGSGTQQLCYLWNVGLACVPLQGHLLSQRWLEHQVWLHLFCGTICQSIMCNRVVQSSVSPGAGWVSPFPQSPLASHFAPTKTDHAVSCVWLMLIAD